MRGRGLPSGHLCFQDATGLETTSNQLLENGPETTRKRKASKKPSCKSVLFSNNSMLPPRF